MVLSLTPRSQIWKDLEMLINKLSAVYLKRAGILLVFMFLAPASVTVFYVLSVLSIC